MSSNTASVTQEFPRDIQIWPATPSIFSDLSNEDVLIAGEDVCFQPNKKSKGGRPVGTTNAMKHLQEQKFVEAKNEITVKYAELKKRQNVSTNQ